MGKYYEHFSFSRSEINLKNAQGCPLFFPLATNVGECVPQTTIFVSKINI